MALATRCPYCSTTFRVAHDQLKLRAGLVRCGACKQIFNGVENLLGPDVLPAAKLQPTQSAKPAYQVSSSPANTPAFPSVAEKPVTEKAPESTSSMPATAGNAAPSSLTLSPPTSPPVSIGTETSAEEEEEEKDTNPLTRMTLMDFTAFEEAGPPVIRPQIGEKENAESEADKPDEIEQAIEDLQNRPWRSEKAKADEMEIASPEEEDVEPDFIRHARRRQRIGTALKWLYGLGSLLLLLALAGQLAYTFRDQLVQRLPQSAPLLQQACGFLGCRIGLPTPIHAVSIESSELRALPSHENTFLLQALLRNRYDLTVAWPHLELTLNDTEGKPVARKVFPPKEYLPASKGVEEGFPPQSEQALNVHFELDGIIASDFRVYLFYP